MDHEMGYAPSAKDTRYRNLLLFRTLRYQASGICVQTKLGLMGEQEEEGPQGLRPFVEHASSQTRSLVRCRALRTRADEIRVLDCSGASRRQRSHKDGVVLVDCGSISSGELGYPARCPRHEAVVEGESWRGHHGQHQRRDRRRGQ